MKILFLITKRYPYGGAEAYLEHEMVYLSEAFQKIYVIPSEQFSQQGTLRSLPVNAEVLFVNTMQKPGVKRAPFAKRVIEIAGLMWQEWRLSGFHGFIFKKFKKHLSVLKHQQYTADVLTPVIKAHRNAKDELYFYGYWIHYGALMTLLLKRRGVITDFVVRGHSIDLYHFNWVLAKMYHIAPLCFHFVTLKEAGLIAPVSNHGKNFLIDKFPGYKGKIQRHYLGVNVPVVKDLPIYDKFVVVSCSHINPNKRINRIPEILRHITSNITWVHFGGGSEQEMENLKNQIASLPSNIRVSLKGPTPNADILEYYATGNVHLVINLSIAEGLPVSLMEAVSYGIPVIATHVYGSPEVANVVSGYSIPVDFSDEDVAELIDGLNNNKQLWAEKSGGAKQLFLENFTAERNFKNFINALQQIRG